MEQRDSTKQEAVKEIVKKRETDVRERNRLREARAKAKEEANKQEQMQSYD